MGKTLVDEMQSLIENLDVEEVEINYKAEKNSKGEDVLREIEVIYSPESRDMLQIAKMINFDLGINSYEKGALMHAEENDFFKHIITFKISNLVPGLFAIGFTKKYFEYMFKQAVRKIEKNKRFTCRFELMGDKKVTRWDESYEEYTGIDLWYFDDLIKQLDEKYPNSLDNINDYRYTLSNLRQEDLSKVEELLDKFENKMDCCYIRSEFIDMDDEV